MLDQGGVDENCLVHQVFLDLDDKLCEIAESSFASQPAIRLGVSVPMMRMHLNQQQVRHLVPILERFATTGTIAAAMRKPAGIQLNEESILQLSADRETDAYLAVHIFGWRWFLNPQSNCIALWPKDVPGWTCWNMPTNARAVTNPHAYERYRDWYRVASFERAGHVTQGLPRWSQDFAAMGDLIHAMRQRNLSWTGHSGWTFGEPAYAGFSSNGYGWAPDDFTAIAEELPLATARAALLAALHVGQSWK